MKKLRVLEAITPSTIGGAEVYVSELCEALPILGTEVDVFCPKGRSFIEFALRRGVRCVNWRTYGKVDPLTVIRLARLIKESPVDLIHTHLSTACLLGAIAARLAGRPSIAHVHGLNTATCYKLSTAVIAVSEAVKQHLCAQGIDERKIEVIHNGVRIPERGSANAAAAKLRLGYDPEWPVFGVFGRLSWEKGQRVALQAMALLRDDFPAARLVLVGGGRDMRALRAMAAGLKIADRVVFAGFVPNVPDFMMACDAVIVPSLREGLGLAALEAMAIEKPVVASAVGGLKEIVVDRVTGFAVPPNDPEAVAMCLKELMDNQPVGASMGRLGRELVEQHFDFSKQVKILAAKIREVAEAWPVSDWRR